MSRSKTRFYEPRQRRSITDNVLMYTKRLSQADGPIIMIYCVSNHVIMPLGEGRPKEPLEKNMCQNLWPMKIQIRLLSGFLGMHTSCFARLAILGSS